MSVFSITEYSQTTSAVVIATTAIPLTTIFTPPAKCNWIGGYEQGYYNGNNYGFNTDPDVQTASCYPLSYREYQWQKPGWYSPGVCPSAYEYVATSLDGPTTLAVCCPPGFYTKGNEWSCTSITTGGTDTFAFFANPISVAWQSSDLNKFTPASAPVVALTKQATRVTSSSSIPSSSSNPHSGSTPTNIEPLIPVNSQGGKDTSTSDLSTGAKAGIGVGTAIAALAIIAGVLFWFARRYQLTRKPAKTEPGSAAEKRDMYGENMTSPVDSRPPVELDDDGHVHEVANQPTSSKAPTSFYRYELAGDMVPELPQDGGRATLKSADRQWR